MLHVADGAGLGEVALPALSQLQNMPGHGAAVIGGSRAIEAAGAAGLGDAHRAPAPLGRPALAGNALRRLARRTGASGLVAWSPGALIGAMASGVATRGVVACAPDTLSVAARRTVLHAARRRAVVFAAPSVADRWAALDRAARRCEVATGLPGLSRAPEALRRDARSWWDVGGAPAIAIMDADGRSAGVDLFVAFCVLTILSLAQRSPVGVCPPGARGHERGLRQAHRLAGGWPVIIDERPSWRWLAGCDAAMIFGDTGPAHDWADQGGVARVTIRPDGLPSSAALTSRMPREVAFAVLSAIEGPRAPARESPGVGALLAALGRTEEIRAWASRRPRPSAAPA
jgi:hypothetical protein